MNISKTILFFGTEDFSAHTLEVLIRQGFHIGAIITKPDSRRGRGRDVVKPLVKIIGERENIPVWQPAKLTDLTTEILNFEDPVGVLVSYGKIIPQKIIDLFHPGIINLHPSLLPKYRGPSPIESAILNGDRTTGISIMQLSAAMDAGPVYYQEHLALGGKETAPELYHALGTHGAEVLVRILPSILDGSLQPVPQHDAQASYCQLIKKSDGIIDWNTSATDVDRTIRSYLGWPQSRTHLGELEVIITKASITDTPRPSSQPSGSYVVDGSRLLIYANDYALSIEELKPLGKNTMPIQAFLAGYHATL